MATFISTLFFITLFLIVIGIVISIKAKKNEQVRRDDSTFIPPTVIGDSDRRHSQDDNDSSDSGDFSGDSGGDGGGGGGAD